jgi:hypothetical protein
MTETPNSETSSQQLRLPTATGTWNLKPATCNLQLVTCPLRLPLHPATIYQIINFPIHYQQPVGQFPYLCRLKIKQHIILILKRIT